MDQSVTRDRAYGVAMTNVGARASAPLAALLYPAIIACGVRTSPIVLAASLAVPLVALVASRAIADFPRAHRIAHLAVAAPPLFSLLGGWLDFQHAIPIHSLGAWIVLWSVLLLTAVTEAPHAEPQRTSSRRLAVAHGITAAAITLFAAVHLANHLGGLFGSETHGAIMHVLRKVYRNPLVEPLLFATLAFQIATGSVLLWRKLARSTGWIDTLQSASGAYMMMFLLSHVSAVLRARHLRGIDTNWAWAAGPELLTDPWTARLAPYYFLAVIAFGVHGACGLRTVALGRGASPVLGTRIVAVGAGVSILVSGVIFTGMVR